MTTSPTTTTARRGTVGAADHRALRVVGAIAAGLVVWVLAVPVLGVELTARSGTSVLLVGPAAVAFAGLLAGLAGWASLALLERLTKHVRGVWTTLAGTVLVLSLVGPFGQATGTAAAVSLAAMHVAVGITVIVSLGSTARPRRG